MSRFRISADGIAMALPGYNVDTAPLDKLVFSTDWPVLRVKYSGNVTATNIPGPWSQIYDTAIYTYPEPFTEPPIVLVAGIVSPTVSDQMSYVATDFYSPGALSYRSPYYAINSRTDRFELYLMARFSSGSPLPSRTKTYRFYVFDSVIES